MLWSPKPVTEGSTPSSPVHFPVAQLVERLAVNQNVGGSSPSGEANFLVT
jgi:hypothetical protein